MNKIISKEDFCIVREQLKKEKKKIILCHGVFDLVHPGHVIHFEEAKGLGDVLVVSVTASKYVRKGPGRPYFNDEMRLKVLSAIEYIDYVLLSENDTVDDIVKCVQPDLYVKGQEYSKAEQDITGKIEDEIALVKKYGGDVYFTSGEVFSSTKLINNFMPTLTQEVKDYISCLAQEYSFPDIQSYLEEMKKCKVLVIGDVIIDNYTFCDMLGIMSKDRGYSVRYQDSKQYLGGVLAIARHIAEFSNHVTVSSIIGNENGIHSQILDKLGKSMRLDLTYDDTCDTIIKQRFIVVNEKREEFDKLFSMNNLPSKISSVLTETDHRKHFKERIDKTIADYDLVVIADFGHGLMDQELMDIVERKAKYLSINCQTNSANQGMNLITKYKRADSFVLDQRELHLAFQDNITEEKILLHKLLQQLDSTMGWLTQASHGATGILKDNRFSVCPALTLQVKDTIGAGDAFFSIASLCAVAGVPLEIATFLGNISGAIASNIVGNEKPVGKVDILKYANTLMNL